MGHVLAQFLRADRLYGSGAVRAAMQLALELRQDVQAMLLVRDRVQAEQRRLDIQYAYAVHVITQKAFAVVHPLPLVTTLSSFYLASPC